MTIIHELNLGEKFEGMVSKYSNVNSFKLITCMKNLFHFCQ